MLAIQRRAGNAALTRAIEEERHEHDAGCGHTQQPAPAQGASALDVIRRPGSPVDPAIRAKAEQGMGTDFGDVEMHTGPEAQRSAAHYGARAYTTGRHIVIGEGGGDELTILHELAHAWQQKKGAVEGTDTGNGERVSNPDDRHEREADDIAHQIKSGGPGPAAAPGPTEAPGPALPTGTIPVVRKPSGGGERRMHSRDEGQMFEIEVDGRSEMGRYVRHASGGRELFMTSRGPVRVLPRDILGLRPQVGLRHPPGRPRPVEENLEDRRQIFLSEADASAARARVRRDPSAADDIAITTYEEDPGASYGEYPHNSEDLRRVGVPILNGVDLSDADAAQRLSHVAPGANLHFQMPHAGRVTGYSTQRLVRDHNGLPGRMNRDDVTTSVTTVHPSGYPHRATHNRNYGMETRAAVPPGMRVVDEYSDNEGLEEFGYAHRISGKDKSAAVAGRRKTYRLEPRRSDSPEEAGPSSRRESDRSRRARTPSRAPGTEAYDDEQEPRPSRRTRRGSRAARSSQAQSVNYAATDAADDYVISQQPAEYEYEYEYEDIPPRRRDSRYR
ncbi:DUF4157 domain-containing protein [Streptomyces shenzhenensis]|uniref:eCIS core domain-containing protein n=1 Tax=Streptomyces shenzhenensis TaxID=943815 RepID=UPI0037F68136